HGERVRVVLVAHGEDLDRLAVLERRARVLHDAVRAHEHGLLGELRPDRARRVEPGGAVGQLERVPVGENDLQPSKDTHRPDSFWRASVCALDSYRYIGVLSLAIPTKE